MADKKVKIKMGWNLDNSYACLPKLFYTSIKPTPVPSPKLSVINHHLANSLGLDIEELRSDDGLALFSGNKIPDIFFPLAQAYAGNQFGHFTMLGDGRAHLLGEHVTSSGVRFDIQLKGSGKTPYSRGGDGRASLGPMLREYIISEAMHALGIPTTRSLCVVTTGEAVFREVKLPGAILTRVASSHLRVGTFQYVSNWGTVGELRTLADYTLQRHFGDIPLDDNRYLSLLQEVIKLQATLIAKWQLVGFIHGVMNTDNMTISGETIDYGPCAFMDNYDPKTVFSSIDIHGRYAYRNQPHIAVWNLSRFAETLLPLLHHDQNQAVKISQDALSEFSELYHDKWIEGMRAKLGLYNQEAEDEALIEGLLSLMHKYNADYTNTFRGLTLGKLEDIVMFETEEFKMWHERWQERLYRQPNTEQTSSQLMKKNNPAVIPRNHRVEEALQAAVKEEDFTLMERLNGVLSNPYEYSPEQTDYSTLQFSSTCSYRTFCGT
jgi:uncharacterized protein YdiU (UPF0061 family)